MPPRGRGGPQRAGSPSVSSSRGISFASVARASSGRGTGRGGPVVSPPPVAANTLHVGKRLPERHVQTVAVKRHGFGTKGKPITLEVNLFETTVSNSLIYHYDVMIPSELHLPQRMAIDLITQLQEVVAPDVFLPHRVVYDGKKNIYSTRELDLGGESKEGRFNVSLPDRGGQALTQPQSRGYTIRVAKAAVINPELLRGFIDGSQTYDSSINTALQAFNVVIRMTPMSKHPFNTRSFFTEADKKELQGGVELWRGYFQSLRPAIDRILINIDISTGLMYRGGPLIDVALEFLKQNRRTNNVVVLASLSPGDRLKLQRFLHGIRIETRLAGHPNAPLITRTIKGLSDVGAHEKKFTSRDGEVITVAEYCRRQNQPLVQPRFPCVEVGSKAALIPMELCSVPEGQLVRRQIPQDQITEVLKFATKRPKDRLQAIKAGFQTLGYEKSEYVQRFGMRVSKVPLSIKARVLDPPKLVYGGGATVIPDNGSWKIANLKFYKPACVGYWIMTYIDAPGTQKAIEGLANGLIETCEAAGMKFNSRPRILRLNGQSDIIANLRDACQRQRPSLIVMVLPENAGDLYTKIKHFGDCQVGVATQCLKSKKCLRLKDNSYLLNVALKINVKLGGVNLVPQDASVPELRRADSHTLVMGADVIHPAPGSEGRPSFTSLVANVDTNTATYSAITRVQESRKEIIADLKEMAKDLIERNICNRRNQKDLRPIKRIIFYRDGVSEGQFQGVLDKELPQLRAACHEKKVDAKFTFIVVGKRHHVRLFPHTEDSDRSGNAPSGTVVDSDITHPTDFDFYLQSHSGILGTSRSAHYSVLCDENDFTPDSLQSLSFALCHVYARSTRSVSIPAPVYYADIVCSRSRNHYAGTSGLDTDSISNSSTAGSQQMPSLEVYKMNFKPVHDNHTLKMYFS